MIHINLIAEKKQSRPKSPAAVSVEGMGSGQNLILVAVLSIGFLVSGG